MAKGKIKTTAEAGSPLKPREGAPPKFLTVEPLLEKFYAWREEFQPGGTLVNEIPDVEGFCYYIDSYRDLLSEYEKKEEFSDAIKRIKNWIYYRKKQLAMTGKMPAPLFIFDAKNNAGYTDKTEVDQHITGTVNSGATDSKLAADYEAFAKHHTLPETTP